MSTNLTEAQVREIVSRVVSQFKKDRTDTAEWNAASYHGRAFRGVYATMEEAIEAAEEEIHNLAKSTTRLFTLRMKDAGDGSQNDIAVLSVISALRDIARHLGNIAVRVPAIKRG